MVDQVKSNSELCYTTPDYMLLPKMRFRLSLSEFWGDEELKKKFLDIVKRNNMAQYYEKFCQDFCPEMDTELYDRMCKKNIEGWQALESTDTVSDLDDYGKGKWREKLEYACTIGDCDKASSIATSIVEDMSNSSACKAEASFCLFRIAYFRNNLIDMGNAVRKIANLMEVSCNSGSDWCCLNKLKVYEALYCMGTRNFSRASSLLLDCIPTFESYELLPFKDVAQYTVLAGVISLSRSELEKQFRNNGILQQTLNTECPQYKNYLLSFYECRYADFFQNLAWIETELKFDPLLRPHYQFYVKEMRVKAYSQLLHAYRTLGLDRMAMEFGVTEQYIEQEIARFIASGRLRCKIDKVSGTIVTVSVSGCDKGRPPDACCERGIVYQNTIKRGDNLLNRLKKLTQVIEF